VQIPSDSGSNDRQPSLVHDVFWGLAFMVILAVSPSMLIHTLESTGGDWNALTGGGGRSGDGVPMWLMFSVNVALLLIGALGTISMVVLWIRRARGTLVDPPTSGTGVGA
jgi:hypothetical protein